MLFDKMPVEAVMNTVEEMEKFGAEFAKTLKNRDVVAFRGGLGAGKTAFVRGIASVLAPDADVSSPTFSIVHEYDGELTLFHFDMYRIDCNEDLYAMGFYDYLEVDGVMLIEWSEKILGELPPEHYVVDISVIGDTGRKIKLERVEQPRRQATGKQLGVL